MNYELRTIALVDFMRDLKAETSKMLKHTAGLELDERDWER